MPDRQDLQRSGGARSLNPETVAIRSEEARRLREAIHKLPPQYRIVLVLRDMEGLTDEEVAEITGLRSGTVRVRLHRARLFVRRELMKMGKPRRRGKIHAVRSRVRGQPSRPVLPVARQCLPNFRTTWMNRSMTRCARNWRNTSTVVIPARPFLPVCNPRLRVVADCLPQSRIVLRRRSCEGK